MYSEFAISETISPRPWLDSQMPRVVPVLRAQDISPEEFARDYESVSKPLIISGAIDHWKARSCWSHQWFKAHYGDQLVPIAVGPRLESAWQKMRLEEFIDLISAGNQSNLYLRQFPVLSQIPELRAYFDPPIYCPADRKLMINLWIGPAGTIQPLHKDNHNPLALINNLLVQLVGRKRVLLISGDQDALVYKRSGSEKDYHYSQVDIENLDLEQFPLFRQAVIQEAIIEPGEMIFIPANTWHYVRSLDESISLSFWWHPSIIVDLISRIASANTVSTLTQISRTFGASISVDDVESFGGVEMLFMALRTLRFDLRTCFVSLCNSDVREQLRIFNTNNQP